MRPGPMSGWIGGEGWTRQRAESSVIQMMGLSPEKFGNGPTVTQLAGQGAKPRAPGCVGSSPARRRPWQGGGRQYGASGDILAASSPGLPSARCDGDRSGHLPGNGGFGPCCPPLQGAGVGGQRNQAGESRAGASGGQASHLQGAGTMVRSPGLPSEKDPGLQPAPAFPRELAVAPLASVFPSVKWKLFENGWDDAGLSTRPGTRPL